MASGDGERIAVAALAGVLGVLYLAVYLPVALVRRAARYLIS
jgi:hypothetical protein